MNSPSIFRANDIRGIYNQDFNLKFCKDLAQALSFLLKKTLNISQPQILIGQDARLSSNEIAQQLIKHLLEAGINVCSIGVVPSPLCYFLIHHYNLSATVIVTASHNPPEYNGFKFLVHKKFNCSNPCQTLKNIFKESSSSPKASKKGQLFEIDPFSPYIDSIKEEFSFEPFPFVVDTGNGALGPLAKKVFTALGLQPFFLCLEPDGRFPHHHPDPTIEKNLVLLKQKILQTSCKLGVGFDGDGDRLVLVTQKGRTLLGDELGFMLLPSLLNQKNLSEKQKIIVADVKCSDWFFEAIKNHGGQACMSPSGHSLTRQEMKKQQALFALEFSGHVFFNDKKNRGFDDALYAFLRVLQVLNNGSCLSSYLPQASWFQTGEVRISFPQKKVSQILKKIEEHFHHKKEPFNALDGIRFSRKTSWGLFRSSTTGEALTLRLEASSAKELSNLKKEFSPFIGVPL